MLQKIHEKVKKTDEKMNNFIQNQNLFINLILECKRISKFKNSNGIKSR